MPEHFHVGAVGLDAHDLTVLRSTVRLRAESWRWVEHLADADVWFIAAARASDAALANDPRVVRVDGAGEYVAGGRVLAAPLKAAHLMRVFDAVVARAPAPEIAPVMPDASAADVGRPSQVPDSWVGRSVRLLKSPNLARYPVSVELLGWLETMQRQPVDVDMLARTLPLDRDMLRDLLDEAARGGCLVDAGGAPVAPGPARRKRFGIW